MNISKKITSYAAFAVLAAGPVIAQPALVGSFEGVTPDGNNAFLFQIVTDDPTGSMAIELAFDANISEQGTVSFFNGTLTGTSDTFAEADNSDSLSNNVGDGTEFDIDEDTYYFDEVFTTSNPGSNPFTGTQTNGFVQTPVSLFMAFGSGQNPGGTNNIVRIVTPDNSIAFSGIIAQNEVNNAVSGVVAVPEPTTAALIGLGGLALLSRKRRQA